MGLELKLNESADSRGFESYAIVSRERGFETFDTFYEFYQTLQEILGDDEYTLKDLSTFEPDQANRFGAVKNVDYFTGIQTAAYLPLEEGKKRIKESKYSDNEAPSDVRSLARKIDYFAELDDIDTRDKDVDIYTYAPGEDLDYAAFSEIMTSLGFRKDMMGNFVSNDFDVEFYEDHGEYLGFAIYKDKEVVESKKIEESKGRQARGLYPGRELTSKSGHKITITDIVVDYSEYDGSPDVTVYYDYEMTDGTKGDSYCNTVDLWNMLKESRKRVTEANEPYFGSSKYEYDEDSEDDRIMYDVISEHLSAMFNDLDVDPQYVSQLSRFERVMGDLIYLYKAYKG